MKLMKVFLGLLDIPSLILLKHFLDSDLSTSVFFCTLFFLLRRLRVIFFWEILQAPLPGISFKPPTLIWQALIPVLLWRWQWKVFRCIFFPWPLRQWFVDCNTEDCSGLDMASGIIGCVTFQASCSLSIQILASQCIKN